ncbi:MAG: DUF166 domain-containing protein [Proteobacteria bacterium]|nr:DUF166 domain-containing protein [Pseudomonadota bacterium]
MQKIVVFQQNGSGKSKIEGINRFGDKRFNIQIIEINGPLPSLIEDTSAYLPETLDADLVLDYLKHQDLSDDLSLLCEKLKIPMISSGKKISCGKAICPRTCCALRAQEGLKDYGQLFGAPKIDLVLDEDKIREIKVLKGAPVLKDDPRIIATLNLNIEALKRVLNSRGEPRYSSVDPLPGETEE